MSNIITTKEFAISKEIIATETTSKEAHLVNEQSKADLELVDFEAWLASYLNTDIVYENVIENSTTMGEPEEDCQVDEGVLDFLLETP